MSWRDEAACVGYPVNWWYEGYRNGRLSKGVNEEFRPSYERARPICARCSVKDACLADALNDERGVAQAERFGMRGGLTPDERRMGRKATVSEPKLSARSRRKFEEHEVAIAKVRVQQKRWRFEQLRASG